MKLKIHFVTILVTTLLLLSFQNCSKVEFTDTGRLAGGLTKVENNNAPEEIIDEAHKYTSVSHHLYYDKMDGSQPTGVQLKLSLISGDMSIVNTNGYEHAIIRSTLRECNIDDARLRNLESLLSSAKICRDVLDANLMRCQAISEADIFLQTEGGNQSIELRPNMCNYGVYLCDGLDSKFRSLLKDLIYNAPAGCK